MARFALTLFLGLIAARACAQPAWFAEEEEKRPAVTPLAMALSLSIEPAVWTGIGVSTSPLAEASRLLRSGHYRLEILQLIFMAQEAGRDLSTVVARRDKGETLRKIAQSLSVDYDRVYDRALEAARDVEDWERRVSSVEPFERGNSPDPALGPGGLPGMRDGTRRGAVPPPGKGP